MSGEAGEIQPAGPEAQTVISQDVAKVVDTIMITRAARYGEDIQRNGPASAQEILDYRHLQLELSRIRGKELLDNSTAAPVEDNTPGTVAARVVDIARKEFLGENELRVWTPENSPSITDTEMERIRLELKLTMNDAAKPTEIRPALSVEQTVNPQPGFKPADRTPLARVPSEVAA
jgi:hypothetical protein